MACDARSAADSVKIEANSEMMASTASFMTEQAAHITRAAAPRKTYQRLKYPSTFRRLLLSVGSEGAGAAAVLMRSG